MEFKELQIPKELISHIALYADILTFGKWLHLSKLGFVDDPLFWRQRLKKDYNITCNRQEKEVYAQLTNLIAAKRPTFTKWTSTYIAKNFTWLFRESIRRRYILALECLSFSDLSNYTTYEGEASRCVIRVCDDYNAAETQAFIKANGLCCVVTPDVLRILILSNRINISVMNYLTLRKACLAGHTKCVEVMLECLSLEDMPVVTKHTCMDNASTQKHFKTLGVLLRDGRFDSTYRGGILLKRMKQCNITEADLV